MAKGSGGRQRGAGGGRRQWRWLTGQHVELAGDGVDSVAGLHYVRLADACREERGSKQP